jgi:hypothetical protein
VLVITTAPVVLYAFVLAPILGRTMMLHKPGVTQSLARFIAATHWDDIPAPVRHQAKRPTSRA